MRRSFGDAIRSGTSVDCGVWGLFVVDRQLVTNSYIFAVRTVVSGTSHVVRLLNCVRKEEYDDTASLLRSGMS